MTDISSDLLKQVTDLLENVDNNNNEDERLVSVADLSKTS